MHVFVRCLDTLGSRPRDPSLPTKHGEICRLPVFTCMFALCLRTNYGLKKKEKKKFSTSAVQPSVRQFYNIHMVVTNKNELKSINPDKNSSNVLPRGCIKKAQVSMFMKFYFEVDRNRSTWKRKYGIFKESL